MKCSYLSLLLALSMAVASAHDQVPGAAQTKPIVIQGATIHVIAGPDIQNGTVLLEDGKITAVGAQVQVPPAAVRINAAGKHVYPGLIESMSDIGLREISAVEETVDRTEYGDRNPNVRSWVAVNPDSELIPVARAGGVLVAMTAPRGRWLRGQPAVIYLDGWTVKEMAVLAPAGLYVDWGAMHPGDDDLKKQREEREEKLARLDALLDEARRYGEGREGQPEQTPVDLRLESLLPVIAGQRPLIVDADEQVEIESAVAYAQSQQLKLIVYGGYDAERCAALLKRYQVPVIIASTYRLPRRRDDPYDASYTLPDRLRRSGVKFAVGGAGAGSPGGAAAARNLPYHAAVAVAHGLPHQEALRSITLSAAEILGVDDRLGSITTGKDATLIIADGDILETETNVTTAFIQGRAVDLGSRHKTLYEKYKLKYSR
ncbi:MAG: amidohydrolase family protein [Rubripirellula sp.]